MGPRATATPASAALTLAISAAGLAGQPTTVGTGARACPDGDQTYGPC